MAARFFCDVCGDEVESTETQRTFETFLSTPRGGTGVKVQIARAIDSVWNVGHICNECIANALTQVKDQLYDERGTRPTQPTPNKSAGPVGCSVPAGPCLGT